MFIVVLYGMHACPKTLEQGHIGLVSVHELVWCATSASYGRSVVEDGRVVDG